MDKPVFFIIPDKVLIELAQQPPRLEEWGKVKRIHPAVKRAAHKFVRAAQQAKPVAKERGQRTRLTPHQGQLVQDLLDKRDKVLAGLGFESFVLLTREQAEQIVLGDKSVLREWQRTLLGL